MAGVNSYLRKFGNPTVFKNVAWGCAILLVLIFGSKAVRWLKKFMDDPFNDNEDKTKADETTEKIKKLIKPDWAKLPREKDFYEAIAKQQEVAMQGWGTNWKVLAESLEGLNGKELEAVYWWFGGRVNEDFKNKAMDLFGWLADEYSWWSLDRAWYWPDICAAWARTELPNKPKA